MCWPAPKWDAMQVLSVWRAQRDAAQFLSHGFIFFTLQAYKGNYPKNAETGGIILFLRGLISHNFF